MSDDRGRGGTGRPNLVRLALPLPLSDLGLSDKSREAIPLDDSQFLLALVLPFGVTPGDEPHVLQVDASGRLIVSGSANATGFAITDDPANSTAIARVSNPGDAIGAPNQLNVNAFMRLLNGTGLTDRARSAGATTLANKTGLGVALNAPAGEFSVQSNPAAGAQAVATQAAGAAGVRHIGRRVSFGFSSQAALAGVSTVTFNLRDGATGAGAILKAWTFDLPAAVIAPFVAHLEISDPGTAATAMTLETAAAVAGLRAFVNLSGFDAS